VLIPTTDASHSCWPMTSQELYRASVVTRNHRETNSDSGSRGERRIMDSSRPLTRRFSGQYRRHHGLPHFTRIQVNLSPCDSSRKQVPCLHPILLRTASRYGDYPHQKYDPGRAGGISEAVHLLRPSEGRYICSFGFAVN
jgi:hypothetical protein